MSPDSRQLDAATMLQPVVGVVRAHSARARRDSLESRYDNETRLLRSFLLSIIAVRSLAMVVPLALIVMGACRSAAPTAPGTSLLSATFAPKQGGPPAALTAKPTRHVKEVKVNPDSVATVKVILDVVKDPGSGGQYLQKVEVFAVRNGGGVLTAKLPSGEMPANRGSARDPLATYYLWVGWRRDSGCSHKFGQTMVLLSGDGSVTGR